MSGWVTAPAVTQNWGKKQILEKSEDYPAKLQLPLVGTRAEAGDSSYQVGLHHPSTFVPGLGVGQGEASLHHTLAQAKARHRCRPGHAGLQDLSVHMWVGDGPCDLSCYNYW